MEHLNKNLLYFQHEQGGVTLLEHTGNSGIVHVNAKPMKKNCSILLKGGDEVVFSSCKHYSYVSLNVKPIVDHSEIQIYRYV